MINLFEEDGQQQLNQIQQKIKTYFFNRYKDCVKSDKKLQNDLNRWHSLFAYQLFKSKNIQIADRINQLYETHKKHLDSNETAFIKSFPNQCWQNIFELAIAELISKNFTLNEKNEPPDLIFSVTEKLYFVECSSRSTSFMDKYDQHLPDFDLIFDVAKIFFDKHEHLKEKNASSECWYFDSSIQSIWWSMTSNERLIIKNKLTLNTDSEVIVKIRDWIFWNRYACFSFKEILPDEILSKLESICFPMGSTSGSGGVDVSFIARCLAVIVCEKLEKSYFQKNNPGIIAISFSMFFSGVEIIPVDLVVNYFLKTFFSTLTFVMKDKPMSFQHKVLSGLKNLYGILIDTSWYNWFPDIVKTLYGANFPAGYNNCYTLIYNETLLNDPNYNGNIFPQIPYLIAAPLSSSDLPISEIEQ